MPDSKLLKHIADLAHCGGLAGLSEAEALAAIRLLTLPHWNGKRFTDPMTLDVLEAVRAAKAVERRSSGAEPCAVIRWTTSVAGLGPLQRPVRPVAEARNRWTKEMRSCKA